MPKPKDKNPPTSASVPPAKEPPRPFPTMTVAAATPAQKFRTFQLPAQQGEFNEWARDHHDRLLSQGVRRWTNPSRNRVTMTFHLGPPRGPLHARMRDPWADSGERSVDLWPPFERRCIIVIAAAATCELPEIWSTAVVAVNPENGEAIGGACPWLRPEGSPIPLGPGISAPEPFDGPEAA